MVTGVSPSVIVSTFSYIHEDPCDVTMLTNLVSLWFNEISFTNMMATNWRGLSLQERKSKAEGVISSVLQLRKRGMTASQADSEAMRLLETADIVISKFLQFPLHFSFQQLIITFTQKKKVD